MMNKKYIIIFILITYIALTYFSTQSAEQVAIKYMEINKIYNDESYQEVKSRIYDISSDYIKDTFFGYDNYPLDDRNPIDYEIHSVSSDLIGFNNYIVYIDFTTNNHLRLISAFEVEDGIIMDSYRVSK